MENKKRLIDANALEGEAICLYTYGGARYIPLRALKKAPTVDAVEVVRCKDCKYYMTIHCTCDGCCISDNWHCADGERRNNG